MINSLPKRFSDKVEFTDKCWLWVGAKNSRGYGRYGNNGAFVRSHRFSWEFFNGEIPDGLLVCHKCDTPSCVNPEHLFLGTYQDNMDDKVSKDRVFKGEEHPSAKLSVEDIDEIRRIYKRGTNGEFSQKGIAKKYGISNQHVSNIINHKKWAM